MIAFRDNAFANPGKLIELIQKSAGTMKVRPDQRVVLMRDLENSAERVRQVTRLLTRLAEMAKAAPTGVAAGLPPVTPVLVKRPPAPPRSVESNRARKALGRWS